MTVGQLGTICLSSGDSGVRLVGTKRFIKVHLDTAQYHSDIMENLDCYSSTPREKETCPMDYMDGICHAWGAPFTCLLFGQSAVL